MERWNSRTFQYFDNAEKKKQNKEWFLKNQSLYLAHVRQPFETLIAALAKKLGPYLAPEIVFTPTRITRPLRVGDRAKARGAVKNHSHATFWEKPTSRFEWNPGIHIQIGAREDDNFVGLGLYEPSSRQMKLLRHHLVEDFDTIHGLLTKKKIQDRWGGIQGPRFVRFPKDYRGHESNPYLWNKQFFLGQNFSRKEVCSRGFVDQVCEDLALALPFFSWVRGAVGKYRR
jgi:uncharacterized protein (TIGR02453 family)